MVQCHDLLEKLTNININCKQHSKRPKTQQDKKAMRIIEIYKDYKRTIQCTTLLKLTLALPSSTVTVQSLETNIFCLLLRYISHILRLQLKLLKRLLSIYSLLEWCTNTTSQLGTKEKLESSFLAIFLDLTIFSLTMTWLHH